MYIHTLVCFCESRQRFSLFSPLNIYISLFFVLSLLPACCRVPLLHSPGARPSVSLSPPSLPAFPPLVLRSCSCRVFRGCRVSSGVSPSASPSPWLVPSCLLCVHPIGRALEALRRPAVLSPLSGCPLVAAVTRPPSGARQYGSGGRCTAYISPAFCPLAYVLPCVPLVVPWLVPWLPSVCPCVCPAAGCRLVAVIGGTPLYPGRRRCGAASAM